MEFTPAGRRWSSPPLALQIMGLLLGGLIVAQLVTLILTLLLPPEPQQQTSLDDIARVLDGRGPGSKTLQRVVQRDPPELAGPGWLTSERSRHELAVLLGRNDGEVQLYFFTPLPFAGTARTLPRGASLDERRALARSQAWGIRLVPVDYLVAQAGRPGPPPGGGAGGGGPGAPDGFGNPGRSGGTRGPGGPGDAPSSTNPFGGPRTGPGPAGSTSAAVPGQDGRVRANEVQNDTAFPTSPPFPTRDPSAARPSLVVPGDAGPSRTTTPAIGAGGMVPDLPSVFVTPEARSTRPVTRSTPATPATLERPAADPVGRPTTAAEAKPSPQAARPSAPAKSTVDKAAPIAVASSTRSLFGLGPAPFVEGDFVAALQVADGWAVVQPVPEPFPNSWQRRVLLWFVIAFALIAPLGWLFSRRLVRPISGFAAAAERLGRDPTAPILAIEGPAEVGRAAHAFNRMQSRLRSFVDDRTAMIGAISHDLRTPLTRLRFRIEDVDESLRDGMLHEVEEMEQMITSVLAFIRDASEPGSREKLDLSSIVEDVVEDAVFVGNDVRLTMHERAPVEVDAIGMRRLLANLVENAVKYGDHARVRLFTDRQDAVTEISDDGPGLPDDELERVFQPFYRSATARSSDKQGSGLGLAVCRSIARAHGGDVHLMRGDRGLIAQVRLPLAYGR